MLMRSILPMLLVLAAAIQAPAEEVEVLFDGSQAGAHISIDTEDVVGASRGVLAVSVAAPGKRTIRLPRPAEVRDLYRNEQIGRGLRSFEADFPARGIRVFALE
jgi:hypothetical protein